MKIAVIGTKGLPAKQGGIEQYCQEIYPRMVERGHCVDLFARSSYINSPWLENYDFRGVRVISLPCLKLRGMDALFSSMLGAILASNNHYDVVHFHALGPSLFTWLPKIASSSTVIITCQGLDWRRAKWGKFSSQLLYLGEKAGVRFADGIIVVSEELRSYFRKIYARETVYIPNAPASYSTTNSNFSYGTSLGLSQGKYIIFLGRLVPEKRPELLLKAFQSHQLAGWKLVFVGGTSDTDLFAKELISSTNGDLGFAEALRGQLRWRIREGFTPYGRDRNVIFTGELQGEPLAEIVRGAGLFVLPSDVEGLPLAMLEAMREGIPVLASDIPPHQQLLSNGRGTLFSSGNVNSLISALDWAIDHPQELAIMAKEAQKYVEANYNWDNITTETLRLYKTLANSIRSTYSPRVAEKLGN